MWFIEMCSSICLLFIIQILQQKNIENGRFSSVGY